MNKKYILTLLVMVGSGLLGGCATSSDKIATAYVSPLIYKDYNCDQITAELARVSRRAGEIAGTIDKNAKGDKVVTGVSLILFWPAAFAIDGDGPEVQEYARLKGEREALEKVSIQKNCAQAVSPDTAKDS